MEWIGKKEGTRNVTLVLDKTSKQQTGKPPGRILIKEQINGKVVLLRTIDVALLQTGHGGTVGVLLSVDLNMKMMVVQVPKEYDLVNTIDLICDPSLFLLSFLFFVVFCRRCLFCCRRRYCRCCYR